MSERAAPPVRTALVTGATSGIGRAIVEHLLAGSWNVVAVGRSVEQASYHAADNLPAARLRREPLDLADLDALPDRLTALAKTHADVDALVLCAARGDLGGLEEFSYARIREVIDLNLTSQIFLTRAFLPSMKRRGQGDVILLGSEAAHRGGRRGTIYCASKFALRGFAEALREECARGGVRVTSVHPAMVRTPFFDDLPIEPEAGEDAALEAAEVAEMVVAALEMRPGAVVDEIRLSPLKRAIRFKK